jgi:glucose/mannose-6-phosphate isomerase
LTAAPLSDLAWATPDQMQHGADAVRALPEEVKVPGIANIVVLGMGSARTAGRALAAIAGPAIPLPIVVESSYRAPIWVDRRSLVIAISGSGTTDEVNHASAQAFERGASLVVISARGRLADLARDRALPFVAIPEELQPARATFGFVAGALHCLMQQAALLPAAGSMIEAAATHLRRRRDALATLAHSLAPLLRDRHVTFQGDTPLGAVAAERWKAQFNQNARQPASASRQPDAGHNEVVAWDSLGGVQSRTEAVVVLRHSFEDARVAGQMDRYTIHMRGKARLEQVHAEGDAPLSALMELVMLGDLTSLAVASLRGVDASAIPFISKTLKESIVAPTVATATRARKNDAAT